MRLNISFKTLYITNTSVALFTLAIKELCWEMAIIRMPLVHGYFHEKEISCDAFVSNNSSEPS